MSLGNNAPLACIFSLQGLDITAEERALFLDSNPLGFILFKRNIDNPAQLCTLTQNLRALFPRDIPILIDQEGGRVQRMRPPHWPEYPPMRALAEDPAKLRDTIEAIAKDLGEVGIDVNCTPVLDVLTPETDNAIGDRAFSDDPRGAAACGAIVCETLLSYGITPVIKHLPGQGRAACDSHKDLPRVDADASALEADFYPFQTLCDKPYSDRIWGMVAHVVFESIDPDYPSSASSSVIDVIRDQIGFDGLLLCDDLDMEALSVLGDIPQRALAVLEAGCDVALYCHGNFDMMTRLADTLPAMGASALERYERSRIRRRPAA